ncbi:MAG: hypothetical protein PHO42_03855 [Candidatus Omnitrophica bacterium]|nr:hypothetical protein [Candidatus Omnitrophota bacterium]
MAKISYAVKIESNIIKMIKAFCLAHGIKQGFFVEKALREQLAREELAEDLLDFKNLRSQEAAAVDFSEYLRKRAG